MTDLDRDENGLAAGNRLQGLEEGETLEISDVAIWPVASGPRQQEQRVQVKVPGA